MYVKCLASLDICGIVAITASPIDPWVQLGGIGVLGFLLFVVLTRTIPKQVETHREIMSDQAKSIESLAQRQESTGLQIEAAIKYASDQQNATYKEGVDRQIRVMEQCLKLRDPNDNK